MKRIQKLSKGTFYLGLFAAASAASLLAARYYGNMTVRGAILLAFGATATSGLVAELVVALIKRWHR
jgi:hypothetical protein